MDVMYTPPAGAFESARKKALYVGIVGMAACAAGFVFEPALPVLLAPALEVPPALLLLLPAAPGLSLELLPQAVSAASPNKTIPYL